jgi:Na+/melibiose symporter-like transporter
MKFDIKKKTKKAFDVLSYSVGYGLGGGVTQVFTLYYMGFLVFAMGLPPLAAGAVIAVGKIWDGFIDPAMGIAVDRTKSRFGSCRPWLLASVVPVFFTYFMLWCAFGIDNTVGKFFYFIFAQILFSTAFSIGTVPYEALLPKIVGSYRERTTYSSFKMVFSGLFSVVGNFIYQSFIDVETAEEYAGLDADFMKMGLVLGVMFAIPLLLTFLGTKEKNVVPTVLDDAPNSLKGVFKSYGELLRCKLYRRCYFLTMLSAFIYYAISVSIVTFVFMVYTNKNYEFSILGIAISFTLSFLVINVRDAFEMSFFIPNVLMMRKKNKHRPFLVDLPLLFVGSLIFLFVAPNSTPLPVFLIGIAFNGAGVSCMNFVPNALMPDLVDVDELITGKRREGTNTGLVSLGKQVVQGLSFLVFGIVLTLFGLSDETKVSPESYTDGGLAALKIMLSVIPIVGGIIMYIISKRYNLDAKNHDLMRQKIAEKRQNGSVPVSDEENKIFTDITGLKKEELWINN